MATFNKHSMPASESPEEYIPSLNFMNQIIRSSLRMGASFRRIIQSLLLILTLTSHNSMEKYGIFDSYRFILTTSLSKGSIHWQVYVLSAQVHI